MENFGTYLLALRQKRGLTLGQVALHSRVSKATVSRWEKGIHLPRGVELVEVMEALQLTAEERTQCLRLLEVPRAIQLDRKSAAELRLSLGDILYALRQRAAKTQDEAAQAAGISRSLYRQWENDDSRPSDAQLHALGFAFGASIDEVVLLTTQALDEAPLERSREALLDRYNRTDLWGIESNAASSLLLLTLLAGFKNLLRQDRADPGDLALILTSMATDARMRYGDRRREHELFLQAHRMALQARLPLHLRTARMVRCLLPAPTGTTPVAEPNAVEKALTWRPRFASRKGEAYLLSVVACALSDDDPGRALKLGEIYCAMVADDPDEYQRRLRDRANLLYHCGQPAESVVLLASLTPQDQLREGLKCLELCRGLIALGSLTEASAYLEKGRSLLESSEMVQIHEMIAQLEESLVQGR